jgi:uncharacterized protein (TIGR02466 family)
MAFKLASIDEIFPMPLMLFEVDDAAKLNKGLLKEIAFRRKGEGGLVKSNRKGWHSERDLFDRKEPAQSTLAQLLLRMMAQATKRVAPETDFTNVELLADGWININQPGAYNSPHDHMGGFWSGVYYVSVPKKVEGSGGAIEFLSPHKALPGKGIINAPITAEKLVIHPEAGTVLMFPSSLVHWVHPNDSDEERVTIAFNGHFRRRPTQVGSAIRSGTR